MNEGLLARTRAALAAPVSEPVRAFAARLGEAAGALGVLFYGSNLRTGELEGVLDFYVLLPGPRERCRIWYAREREAYAIQQNFLTLVHSRASAGRVPGRSNC